MRIPPKLLGAAGLAVGTVAVMTPAFNRVDVEGRTDPAKRRGMAFMASGLAPGAVLSMAGSRLPASIGPQLRLAGTAMAAGTLGAWAGYGLLWSPDGSFRPDRALENATARFRDFSLT